MDRCGLGVRVVVPTRGLSLGHSLGLEVLGPGICIPAQQVTKRDPPKPLSTVALHDMDHAQAPAGLPASQPRMFITLSLEDEAAYEEAAANACNVTRRNADQDVHDILRRQVWDGRRPDVLDADLIPDKLTQFSHQPPEALSPFDRTTLDKLHTFAIHLAIMSTPDFTKRPRLCRV